MILLRLDVYLLQYYSLYWIFDHHHLAHNSPILPVRYTESGDRFFSSTFCPPSFDRTFTCTTKPAYPNGYWFFGIYYDQPIAFSLLILWPMSIILALCRIICRCFSLNITYTYRYTYYNGIPSIDYLIMMANYGTNTNRLGLLDQDAIIHHYGLFISLPLRVLLHPDIITYNLMSIERTTISDIESEIHWYKEQKNITK